MTNSRPNLLLITTDQQRWDTLSRLGRPGYRTPVLDRLAEEGTFFDWAYCPGPMCTPARVSILTGQYPTRHGAYEIGMEPVEALRGPTIAPLLAAGGYHSAIIGKTHFVARCIEHQHVAGVENPSPDKPDPDEDFWKKFDGPYVGFDYVRHCQSHTCDRPPNGHYRAWLNGKGVNLDHLHFQNKDGKKVHSISGTGKWDIDESLTQTAWITEESIAYMERRQKTGQPWFCWASYQDPHPPFVCPEPYYSAVDMTGLDLGGLRPGEMEDKPPLYKRFIEGHYWTEEPDINFWDGINVPAIGLYETQKDPEKAIRAYIAMVNMIDVYVGRLLDALDRMGARENTLVVFTTDHGDMLGRHGMWGKGVAAYDDHQRIPAIACWPAEQKGPVGGTRSMFNLVDILPTFLDAAGLEIPPGVQGISQMPVIRGQTQMLRDWALVDFMATVNLYQQTFVHDGYKLVVYRHSNYGELYNLTDDPDQYVNLFDRPEAREIRNRMMQRLVRAHMESAGKMPRRIASA